MANPQAATTPRCGLSPRKETPVHSPTEATPNDSSLTVLTHPEYRHALKAISEHRLAKARGDDFEEQRHLRRAKQAIDAVLADLRASLP